MRLRVLAALLFLVPLCATPGSAENLKLLVSVQQQNIVAPNPVRATLHFHNSGKQTLWLYRPVLSKLLADVGEQFVPGVTENRPGGVYGGSTLKIQFVALSALGGGKNAAGRGFVIAPDALPFPRLVRVAPGGDYEERVNIRVDSAQTQTSDGADPVWGRYRFSVTYSADYSNAEILEKDIHAHLWHGQVESNTVTLNLQTSTAQGSISGTVLDRSGRPYGGALVTLSDDNENAINQLHSDNDGQFSFSHLPPAQYWITVRNPYAYQDTAVFRHFELTEAAPSATAQIMMIPVENNKADRLLHKPVIFHVVDNKGRPLAKVRLVILYSMGRVIENVKAQTAQDGFAAVSLIPGPNFVTLRGHGCKKEDRRADVVHGPGVDGFEFVYDCSKK